MKKPNGYENTQAYGEREVLEDGGHVCVIMKVEEMTSRTGKPMVKVYLDTAPNDRQPKFFLKTLEKWL